MRMRMCVTVMMIGTMVIVLRHRSFDCGRLVGINRRFVMVEWEKALQQKYAEETRQNPPHARGADVGVIILIAGSDIELRDGFGQQVQHGDAEHHARDEAEREFESAVCEAHEHRDPSAGKRCNEDDEAVNGEQRRGGHGRMVGANAESRKRRKPNSRIGTRSQRSA